MLAKYDGGDRGGGMKETEWNWREENKQESYMIVDTRVNGKAKQSPKGD